MAPCRKTSARSRRMRERRAAASTPEHLLLLLRPWPSTASPRRPRTRTGRRSGRCGPAARAGARPGRGAPRTRTRAARRAAPSLFWRKRGEEEEEEEEEEEVKARKNGAPLRPLLLPLSSSRRSNLAFFSSSLRSSSQTPQKNYGRLPRAHLRRGTQGARRSPGHALLCRGVREFGVGVRSLFFCFGHEKKREAKKFRSMAAVASFFFSLFAALPPFPPRRRSFNRSRDRAQS